MKLAFTSSRHWPHVRAALVLAHVVAVLFLASPALQSGGTSKKAWKDKAVQAELSMWTERLRGMGLDVTKDELEARLWDLSMAYMDARGAALQPFKPYARYLGAGQNWQLFVAPQVYTSTLHVDVEIDGRFQTVFVDNDPAYRWLAPTLEHDRFQSALFWFAFQDRRKDFRLLAEWLARHAAEDFPGATRLRVRFFKTKTPSPEESRAGLSHPGRFERTLVVDVRRPS